MDTTTLEAPHADAEPVTAPLWKNLIFLKDGHIVMGAHTFASEAEARAAIAEGEPEIARLLSISARYRVVRKGTGVHLYFCREYSHAIPVPVGAP